MNSTRALDPFQVVETVLSKPSRRVEAELREYLHSSLEASDLDALIAALARGEDAKGEPLQLRSPFWRASKELRPYDKRHGADAEYVVFWPEDFPAFFVDLALEIGIDVHTFGRKLQPGTQAPNYAVGRALTILAEVEQVYADVPGALTETRVPRRFLYAVASALIGMASGVVVDADPLVSSAIGGVGGLLLEVLGSRYESEVEPTTDFLEDLVLRELESAGRMSARQLRDVTRVRTDLLSATIRRLLRKKLIRRIPTYVGGKGVLYDLTER